MFWKKQCIAILWSFPSWRSSFKLIDSVWESFLGREEDILFTIPELVDIFPSPTHCISLINIFLITNNILRNSIIFQDKLYLIKEFSSIKRTNLWFCPPDPSWAAVEGLALSFVGFKLPFVFVAAPFSLSFFASSPLTSLGSNRYHRPQNRGEQFGQAGFGVQLWFKSGPRIPFSGQQSTGANFPLFHWWTRIFILALAWAPHPSNWSPRSSWWSHHFHFWCVR